MAIITEDYVSFKTAKLLKEKGFDEPIGYFYKFGSKVLYRGTVFTNTQIGDKFYNAPTLQMAMKWLREVYNIDIFPWRIGKGIYSCAIFNSTGQDLSSGKDFPSEKYEETVDEAIFYCLQNLI